MHANVTPDTAGLPWIEIHRKCTIKDKRDVYDDESVNSTQGYGRECKQNLVEPHPSSVQTM